MLTSDGKKRAAVDFFPQIEASAVPIQGQLQH